MYKLFPNDPLTGKPASFVIRLSDMACIPFDPANTDYQQFKTDMLHGWTNGVSTNATLQDADGNVMTREEADAFIATLP